MDALKIILTRRSVRRFLDKPVPEELLRTLLEAAMQAPSAGNAQPWHFVVITARDLLDAIPQYHPHAQMLRSARAAILVCADPTAEKYKDRWPEDCSAATQNILLAAHALGLGAVWVGVHPTPERVERTRALLNIPEHIIPLALVPVGYPAEHPAPVRRYNEARVHQDGWTKPTA